jgi:hypothetical protein
MGMEEAPDASGLTEESRARKVLELPRGTNERWLH